ncbi:phytoene desaturase family protein [Rhizosaccharibacter radicis]|uniref:Phytoene desaturase family protein n=1 Tax=Rhizosaccharibacter radicis TaxID=2782605 RepID=A0ABT1VZF6_9PROT|nr:phytoene desaturase family protein [Acetobacteraceae bacterium KSS12]
MTRSVSIIGAGPGGLAAAMLLAGAGADVTVFERHAQVGGRSGTIDANTPHGRFHFDIGPTFFLYPRVLADIFSSLGRRLEDHVELIRLGTHYDLLFGDGARLSASSDIPRLQREVARLSPRDAERIPDFLADSRRKLAAFRPVLERPFNSLLDVFRPDMLRALPLLRPQRSVDADLGHFFSDPRVRLAFSFQSKYLGMSPYRCPSLFTILAFMEYEFGIFHPRGGHGAVMRAMADVARQAGVRFRMNEPVREILTENRRATGVRTDLGETRSDAVVLNADFLRAMTTLLPDAGRRRWRDKRVGTAKLSCSTFMLYLGVRGRLDGLAHHTVVLSREYEQNLREIEEGRAPPGEPSFYMQNACITDPALAPPDHSTLYVLVPVGHNRPGGTDWTDAERARYRALVMERLKRSGLPDIEERIVFEKVMTPDDWEADLDVHRGAVFNLAHNLGQMLNFRPHNRFEDVRNMYLVGGGTHPGSGLPVIFEGARISASLLAQDLGLRPIGTGMEWNGTADAPERNVLGDGFGSAANDQQATAGRPAAAGRQQAGETA